jgi:ATP-dependent DNA ligase
MGGPTSTVCIRCFEHEAIACAFDLLRLERDDMRRLPLSDRKVAALNLACI